MRWDPSGYDFGSTGLGGERRSNERRREIGTEGATPKLENASTHGLLEAMERSGAHLREKHGGMHDEDPAMVRLLGRRLGNNDSHLSLMTLI